MLGVLQFVFSSFWIWLGTLLLIVAIGGVILKTAVLIIAIFVNAKTE